MVSKGALVDSEEWKALSQHYESIGKGLSLRQLFSANPQRFQALNAKYEPNGSHKEPSILLDFSKNLVNDETLRHLFALLRGRDVEGWRERMFSGEAINFTEQRAVLHVALRNDSGKPVLVDGVDVMPEVLAVRKQMRQTSEAIRSGAWKGYTGQAIKDVVNIGIGLVVQAL